MVEAKPIIEALEIRYPPEKVFEVFKNQPNSMFLDGGMDYRGAGRFSYIVANPFLVFKAKGRQTEITTDSRTDIVEGNPLYHLKKIFNDYRIRLNPPPPFFSSGAVGYFGYDLGWQLEKMPNMASDDVGLADIYLGFYNWTLIFDSLKKQWLISSTGLPERNFQARYTLAKDRIKLIKAQLRSLDDKSTMATPITQYDVPYEPVLFSNFTKKNYLRAVGRIKQHIAKGDIYQANLSQRFTADLTRQPYELYRRLRTINPAPLASFLNLDTMSVISASPEQFLRISDRDVITRPIKGTRPRGRTAEEDRRLEEELLSSTKDRAELVMIVDLERNDLGKVCDYGSVRVGELYALERYATVSHLVATVRGRLHENKDHIDCIKACFPGGSITGAPKIRAMEILEELEPTKRGIYTGSIGYIGFNQQTNLNIVIRTMIAKNDRVYFHVGGGIVADSDPESEYQETLHKAKALIEALYYQDVPEQYTPHHRLQVV
jgi:para-aminobenzoate synthetase component 1